MPGIVWWVCMGVWRLQNGGFRAVYSENRTEMAMRILSAPLAFDGGVAMPSAACQGLLTGLLDREPALVVRDLRARGMYSGVGLDAQHVRDDEATDQSGDAPTLTVLASRLRARAGVVARTFKMEQTLMSDDIKEMAVW